MPAAKRRCSIRRWRSGTLRRALCSVALIEMQLPGLRERLDLGGVDVLCQVARLAVAGNVEDDRRVHEPTVGIELRD